jgi:hypothetical protein
MTAPRPAPFVERDSATWWDAVARHELHCARCDDCGAWRWPVRALCARCGSLAWSSTPVSGRGTVASWVVNRHDFGGAVPSPSTVVLVRLAEQDDLLMPGAWSGPADGAGLAVDLPVAVGFLDVPAVGDTPGFTLCTWRSA